MKHYIKDNHTPLAKCMDAENNNSPATSSPGIIAPTRLVWLLVGMNKTFHDNETVLGVMHMRINENTLSMFFDHESRMAAQ